MQNSHLIAGVSDTMFFIENQTIKNAFTLNCSQCFSLSWGIVGHSLEIARREKTCLDRHPKSFEEFDAVSLDALFVIEVSVCIFDVAILIFLRWSCWLSRFSCSSACSDETFLFRKTFIFLLPDASQDILSFLLLVSIFCMVFPWCLLSLTPDSEFTSHPWMFLLVIKGFPSGFKASGLALWMSCILPLSDTKFSPFLSSEVLLRGTFGAAIVAEWEVWKSLHCLDFGIEFRLLFAVGECVESLIFSGAWIVFRLLVKVGTCDGSSMTFSDLEIVVNLLDKDSCRFIIDLDCFWLTGFENFSSLVTFLVDGCLAEGNFASTLPSDVFLVSSWLVKWATCVFLRIGLMTGVWISIFFVKDACWSRWPGCIWSCFFNSTLPFSSEYLPLLFFCSSCLSISQAWHGCSFWCTADTPLWFHFKYIIINNIYISNSLTCKLYGYRNTNL